MFKILCVLLLLLTASVQAQLPESLPFRTFLGENEEIYVTGNENGCFMTVKYGSDGNEIFKHVSSQLNTSKGMDVVAVPGGEFAYASGYFYNSRSGFDIVLIKYKYSSNSGEKLWQRTYNFANGDDKSYGITLDASGNVYVCGHITDANNEQDFVVIKYDSSGTIDMVFNSEYPGDDAATEILCDNNFIYTMGYKVDLTGFNATTDMMMINMDIDLNANTPVVLSIPDKSEVPLGFIIAEQAPLSFPPALSKVASIGYQENFQNNNDRNYIVVYFEGNTLDWDAYFGDSTKEDVGTGITTDLNGNIVVTGYTQILDDDYNFASLKFNKANGVPIWSNPVTYDDNNGEDKANSIDMKNGIYTVTGFSQNNETSQYITTTFYDDNVSGPEGWSSQFIPSYLSQGTPVFTDFSTKSYILADSSVLTLTFAWNALTSVYSFVKYDKYGEIISTGEAGDNQGILKNGINSSPDKFELSQNYPNPFNPQTNITFSIPDESFVTLTVYDILGREVSRLVNSNLKKGVHSVQFNGSDLSSGIYLYKISARSKNRSFEMIKKMTLIK